MAKTKTKTYDIVLASGPEAGRIICQFDSEAQADEWCANVANEDMVLTETAWAGQEIAIRIHRPKVEVT